MRKLYNCIKLSVLCVAINMAFVSCSGNDSKETIANVPVDIVQASSSPPPATQSPSPTPTATPTPIPTPDLSGKSQNPLTGLLIDKEVAKKRPYAIVINNMKKALPQSGISQADIYYEVLAEGDITRLVCLFQDFDSKKIGPIRSTRDYFADFALDNNAICVHHGGSDPGYIAVKTYKINRFDGQVDSDVLWRDPVRFNAPGMYEHSSYTDAEKLLAGTAKKKFNTERFEDAELPFEFYPEASTPVNSKPAKKLTVPFSPAYTSVFEYDDTSKTYKKFQGEKKHIDEESGTQLEVSNIIFQVTNISIIPSDKAGRRKVDLVGSGKGYLLTNGGYVPLTWSKKSHTAPTQWFGEDGKKLKLNQGKTWICIYDGELNVE